MPIAITEQNRKRDIPITIFVTLVFILFGLYRKDISRLEGIIFLALFAVYIYYCFKNGNVESEDDSEEKQISTFKSVVLVLAGLCGLIFGGRFFVDSATKIAAMTGVSDKFVAITILAGGTSLPELATCVVAAVKKKGQLALGNILGSNIFNILLILGTSAIVTPLSFASMNFVDLGVLLVSAVLVFSAAYTGEKDAIDRSDGIVMLLCEAAYFVWLVISI